MTSAALNRYRNKTVPQLLKLATKHFNKFIRERDTTDGYFQCISCDEWKGKEQLNAGHFYSAGQHAAVRFDPDNVHAQCIACNCHRHGALLEYREGLLAKIGESAFQRLEVKAKSKGFGWDKMSLAVIIETYKAKCKDLESLT